MEKSNFIQKCITIEKEQEDFLVNETFNLSKFVRVKLSDYIKSLKEYRMFMEVKNETKITR